MSLPMATSGRTRKGLLSPAQWASTDDLEMMQRAAGFFRPTASPVRRGVLLPARKLRLFACACARTLWGVLSAKARLAVEVAEAYADGEGIPGTLGAARRRVQRAGGSDSAARWACLADAAEAAWQSSGRAATGPGRRDGALACDLLRCVAGSLFRPHKVLRLDVVPDGTRRGVPVAGAAPAGTLRCVCGVQDVCPLGREGNAHRCTREEIDDSGVVEASGWLTADVLALAEAAYLERAVDGFLDAARLGVLADALDEAGCPARRTCADCGGGGEACSFVGGRRVPDAAWRVGSPAAVEPAGTAGDGKCHGCGGEGRVPFPVLEHLRSPGPHARGCWAVDLVRRGTWP